MLQQSIAIAVIAVLSYFQIHRQTVIGNASATSINKVIYGRECSHIIVNNHTASINTNAYTVVEYQWYMLIYKKLEVIELGCILSL